MAILPQQELVKLVSLYKSFCSGILTKDSVINEMLDTKVEMDRLYYLGYNNEHLSEYYNELEYLLIHVMGYEHA